MRKPLLIGAVVVALGAGAWMSGLFGGGGAAAPAGGAGRPGGGFGGGFGRPPMTVELTRVSRGDLTEYITVVGSLIGAATVDVAPKVSGRLRAVPVRLGDRVGRGQVVAQIEDSEIREQVKQAEASFDVASASVRQREADLKFAETSLERSRNLYNRQLLPKQTLDDSEARYEAARAQLDLARAQFTQAGSRLEELRLTLGNTVIASPVDGFVGRRLLDPGAFVSSNTTIMSVVDISFVRLVVNLVEKDLRRVRPGTPAAVEVDALPGRTFDGRVARIAPVLDPATRTAEMEIEIPNRDAVLKPGMYARVRLTTARRPEALVLPLNAIVDSDGRRGVYQPADGKASFLAVETGVQEGDRIEILKGLSEGDTVITTGAAGLREGDPIVVPGAGGGPGGGRQGGGGRPAGSGGPPAR